MRDEIVTFFDGAFAEAELFVPYARHGLVRRVHEAASVVSERYDEAGTHLVVRGPERTLERLRADVAPTE